MATCRNLLALLILTFPLHAIAQSYDWFERVANSPSPDEPDQRTARFSDSVATEDGVYAAGHLNCREYAPCEGVVAKYAPDDGSLLWQRKIAFEAHTYATALTVNEHGVFVVGHFRPDLNAVSGNPSFGSFVRRYTHDGNTVWTLRDWQFDLLARAIASDAHGLYVLGRTQSYPHTTALRHLDFDGNEIYTNAFLGSWGYEIQTGDDYVFITGGNAIHVHRGGSWPVNLTSVYGTVGGLNQMVYRDGYLYFVDYFDMILQKYRIDGQRTPELVWRVEFSTEADGLTDIGALASSDEGLVLAATTGYRGDTGLVNTGQAFVHLDFDGKVLDVEEFPAQRASPLALSFAQGNMYIAGEEAAPPAGFVGRYSETSLLPPSVVALRQGDVAQAPELAVLQHGQGAGPVVAEVRAVAAGSASRKIRFADTVKPVEFFALPDLNGNGHDELVVVSRRGMLAEIRDSMLGSLVNTLPGESNFEPIVAAVELPKGSSGTAVLAVVARQKEKGWLRLRLYDLTSGSVHGTFAYNQNFEPVDVEVLPDLNADGEAEYAVLARNAVAGLAHKVEIRSRSGELVRNIWLGSAMAPVEFQRVGDSGTTELAVLNYDDALDWMGVAFVHLSMMQVSSRLPFNGTFQPQAFAVAPDANGNGAPQVMVYGADTNTHRVKLESRDAFTGALDYNAFQWQHLRPRDAVYLGHVPGLSESAVGLLSAVEPEPGALQMNLLDARSGSELLVLKFAPSAP